MQLTEHYPCSTLLALFQCPFIQGTARWVGVPLSLKQQLFCRNGLGNTATCSWPYKTWSWWCRRSIQLDGLLLRGCIYLSLTWSIGVWVFNQLFQVNPCLKACQDLLFWEARQTGRKESAKEPVLPSAPKAENIPPLPEIGNFHHTTVFCRNISCLL